MTTPHFQVTCHTPDNLDSDRRLQGLGGPGNDGNSPWWHDIDTLIDGIEHGRFNLWTKTPDGRWAWVYVVNGRRRKYLTTDPDGLLPNNLLALRVCP